MVIDKTALSILAAGVVIAIYPFYSSTLRDIRTGIHNIRSFPPSYLGYSSASRELLPTAAN